jgi:hypothetical protein
MLRGGGEGRWDAPAAMAVTTGGSRTLLIWRRIAESVAPPRRWTCGEHSPLNDQRRSTSVGREWIADSALSAVVYNSQAMKGWTKKHTVPTVPIPVTTFSTSMIFCR